MTGTVLHLTLAIPRGYEGVQGPAGVQGPPFVNAIVDAMNTLPPGSAATVSVTFDGTNVHFTFRIPQGAEGLQGPPGDVSNSQLATAIGGTSSNTNAVATLDTPFADPDAESMRLRFNELVLALRRQGAVSSPHRQRTPRRWEDQAPYHGPPAARLRVRLPPSSYSDTTHH